MLMTNKLPALNVEGLCVDRDFLGDVVGFRMVAIDGIVACEHHGRQVVSAIVHADQVVDDVICFCCPVCVEAAEREETRAVREKVLADAIAKAGIRGVYLTKSFDNYFPRSDSQDRLKRSFISYFNRFDEMVGAGLCLLVSGSPGTGKSHLANALVRSVVESGRSSARIITLSRIFRLMRDTWGDRELCESDVLVRLVGLKLLVIDDFAAAGMDRKESAFLFDLIDGRAEMGLPTIAISNLDVNELTDFAGARVIDRLSGAVMTVEGESNRRVEFSEAEHV